MVYGGWCCTWDGERSKLKEKDSADKGHAALKTRQNAPSSWDQDIPAPGKIAKD